MSKTASDVSSAKLFLETVPPAMRMVRTEMRRLVGDEFTIPQFRLLFRISRGAASNLELAEWMGVKPPTMSKMVDTMVRRGYARRGPSGNPADRRVIQIETTRKGFDKARQLRNAAANSLAIRIALLPAHDKQLLVGGLKVLKKYFVTAPGGNR